MNIFVLSPGRTATTTLALAFAKVGGYTSAHQSLSQELGDDRINFPSCHFEFDNRLTWFLPRLTKKYGNTSVLVIVRRDPNKIAASYNRRWYKINMMKAYTQGILMRPFSGRDDGACKDFVRNVYEHLDSIKGEWRHCIELDLESPDEGVREILNLLDRAEFEEGVLATIRGHVTNLNTSGFIHRMSITWFNLRVLWWDLWRS